MPESISASLDHPDELESSEAFAASQAHIPDKPFHQQEESTLDHVQLCSTILLFYP